MENMQSDIVITIKPSQHIDFSSLESDWLALEVLTDSSFFLTWSWIGNWLKQCIINEQAFYVLQAHRNNGLVGLAIIIKQQRKVFGVFPVKQWWLNRSGVEILDQCWIEENNFLMAKENQLSIQLAFFDFLKSSPEWQELVVGMADANAIADFSTLASHRDIIFDDKGYSLDYTNIDSPEHYLQSVLSRNTRQKIKQSEKLLIKEGALSLHVLTQAEDKIKHVNNISRLHINRWQKTETPSGFTNLNFYNMIIDLLRQSNTEVIFLAQNEISLGYLIFFIHGDKAYFYLSALASHRNNKVKLGMLLHQKAITHYLQSGFTSYDFLAGDARYKKSLVNREYTQQMVSVFRPSVLLLCEEYLKKSKQMYRNIGEFCNRYIKKIP